MKSMNLVKYFFTIFLFLGLPGLCQEKGSAQSYPADADVWVLAGQSNMDGCGRTPDTLTNPGIMMYGLDNKWTVAQNPVHRIYDAAAPAYELIISHYYPAYKDLDSQKVKAVLAQKRLDSRQKPIGGVGPGIYFARYINEHAGKNIALIPCGIGGTTMEQWSPDRIPRGDSSLYGAMINRIKSVGGNLKGVVWFQGESEAMSGKTDSYENDLLYLVDRIRKDTGYKDLPIIIVQIGCFNIHNPAMDKGYETVRDIQRNIYKKRNNLFVVSCIDLPLDDWAHISTEGQKRLGKRIAEIALTGVYNKKGYAEQINLESIKMCKDSINGSNYLLVHFSGIREKLQCCGKPGTFELRVNGTTTYEFVVAKAILDQDDPAGIRLYLSGVPESNAQLVFGPGTNPYVNLTDNLDNGIPVFGPIDIPLK